MWRNNSIILNLRKKKKTIITKQKKQIATKINIQLEEHIIYQKQKTKHLWKIYLNLIYMLVFVEFFVHLSIVNYLFPLAFL